MKRISYLLLALIVILGSISLRAADFTTISNGDFNDPSIWDQGAVPSSTDRVFINHSVSLPGSYTNSVVGQVQVNLTGSLFIEDFQNSGTLLNYGLLRSIDLTNEGDFLNEGILEVNTITNQLNGTINNLGRVEVNDQVNNMTPAFFSNQGFMYVANNVANSGGLELPQTESILIVSGNVTNQTGGYLKLCGRLGLGDKQGESSTNSKVLTNNGTIDGCDGGIAGDLFSQVINNSILLNTVFVCLESGNVTNVGTGSFTISCCFLMVAEAGENRRICDDAATTVGTTLGGDPTANFGIGPYTYQWSEVGGVVFSSQPNPTVFPTVTTAYAVAVTDSETPTACVKRDTVLVRVTGDVIARAGEIQFICEGESATLGANQTGSCGTAPYSFEWSPAEGLDDATIANPVASPASTTRYVVTVTDDSGGIDRDTTYVFIQPQPPAAEAGDDQELCDVTSTTLAAESVIGGAGEWSVVSGDAGVSFTNISDPNTDVSGLAVGTTVLKWTATSGVCETSDEVTITIDPQPTTSIAGADQLLCEQSSTVMAANDAVVGDGEWVISSGTATIVDVNNPQTEVNDLPTDGSTVVLTWTISSGLCGSSSDDVSIQVEENPPVVEAGADQELCNVTETTLEATIDTGNATSGFWSIVSGSATIATPSSPTTDVSNLVVGTTATFKYTIPGTACDDSESEVSVTVYAPPSDADAGPDQVFCAGETTANLSATPPAVGVGEWKVDTGATFDDISNPNTVIRGLTPGTTEVMWIVSNGSCEPSVDVLFIEVFEEPSVNVSSASICLGEEVQLEAVGGQDYLWSPADGLNQTDIANPIASPEVSTTYSVEVFRTNCPTQTFDIEVLVNPVPEVEVSPRDTILIIGQSVQLLASGAENYEWSPSTSLDNAAIANPVASPVEDIVYTVRGTNEFGCFDDAQVAITVDENFEIFVPDMFTPNDDGNNDLLMVNVLGVKAVEFSVFDRFGNVVFSTDNEAQGWDGKIKGKEANIDVYPYVVKAELFSGRLITKKGTVQLIR